MWHLKLFEKFQDHPILDFFQEIIDDYKIDLSIGGIRGDDFVTSRYDDKSHIVTIRINGISNDKYIPNNDISEIVSVLITKKSSNRLDSLKKLSLIKRIENTSEYKLFNFYTVGFKTKSKQFDIILDFIL